MNFINYCVYLRFNVNMAAVKKNSDFNIKKYEEIDFLLKKHLAYIVKWEHSVTMDVMKKTFNISASKWAYVQSHYID